MAGAALMRQATSDRQNEAGKIRISPVHKSSGLRGLGVGSNLNTEKFTAFKKEEMENEAIRTGC